MKKSVFFVVLTMFLSNYAFCQTLEETSTYLKTYYTSMQTHGGGEFTMDYNTDLGVISTVTPTGAASSIFVASEVRAINYYHQNAHDGYYDCWVVEINQEGNSNKVIIAITSDKDEKYISKFVKALTRFAVLFGAKNVKSDLFDN